MTRLPLPGCRPEPLLSYLKALGIFRLVAEQADKTARAAWEDDVFILHTTLSQAELVAFFIHKYHPTPIVVPWSGDDFFGARDVEFNERVKKTPTGAGVIAAVLSTKTPRLSLYRQTIEEIYNTMSRLNLAREKPPSHRACW